MEPPLQSSIILCISLRLGSDLTAIRRVKGSLYLSSVGYCL